MTMRTPQMQPTILNAKPTRNLQMSVFLASLPFHVANIRGECLTQMGINLLNIPQPEGMTSTYKMQPRLYARSEPKSSGATVLYNLNLNRRGPTKTPKGLPHWGEGTRPAQVFPKKVFVSCSIANAKDSLDEWGGVQIQSQAKTETEPLWAISNCPRVRFAGISLPQSGQGSDYIGWNQGCAKLGRRKSSHGNDQYSYHIAKMFFHHAWNLKCRPRAALGGLCRRHDLNSRSVPQARGLGNCARSFYFFDRGLLQRTAMQGVSRI